MIWLRKKIDLAGLSLGHLLATLQPIVLLVVLTRYLGLEDYGLYSRIIILSGFFQPFILFAYNEWYLKEYFREEARVKHLFYQGVVLLFALTSFLTVISGLTFIFFSYHFGYVLSALILAFTTSMLSLMRTHGVAVGSAVKYLIFNGFVNIAVLTSIFLLIKSDYRISGQLVVVVVSLSYVLSSIFGIFYFGIGFDFRVTIKELMDSVRFLYPLVIFSVLALLSSSLDKYFATLLFDDRSMAQYYSHFQVSFGLSSFFSVVSVQWNRNIYASKDGLSKEVLVLFRRYVIFGLLVILVYAFFTPVIRLILFPRDYEFKNLIIAIFIVGIFFQYLYMLYRPITIKFNNRVELTYAACVGIAGGLIGNYTLIYLLNVDPLFALPLGYAVSWILITARIGYKMKIHFDKVH